MITSTMLWTVDASRKADLHEQIAANVRRAIADGALVSEERLPPARELATVLDVNSNTVLVAYRQLRAEGLLEFRRGRGVSVHFEAAPSAAVTQAAHHLLGLGRRHGWQDTELIELLTRLTEEKV